MGTIAWAEASRTGGSFNKRTALLLGVLGLAMAFLTPQITDDGLAFDKGIYRASLVPDAQLLPAVRSSHVFVVLVSQDPMADLAAGRAEVAVFRDAFGHEVVFHAGSDKGEAALAALRQAAKDHTFAHLLEEEDQAAAFPVRVELRYAPQDRVPPGARGSAVPTRPTAPSGIPGATEPGSVTGGEAGGAAAEPLPTEASSGFSFLPPERSINTPETLAPPFPFRSLLLAYAFLIPMNFVVQVYAGSAIAERLGRKGETLLASPARPWEIIAGKALPYFALMMLISGGIVLWIGAGWLSLLAIAPLVLAFLALEFVAAMFARSFRELTFLTVFTSVLLTIYAFLPAVFTSVHPIALVSPIALVVFDLRDDPVTLAQVLYATVPLSLVSLILFRLGGALYSEEDLFHQKPVLTKAVDAVARQVRGLRSGIKLSFLLLPLVFVVELLLVTFLFAWPVGVGVVGVMLAVALVEETFKALPSYAGVRRGRIPAARAAVFGVLVGVGFFLAEKSVLLASLVGLMDVPAASAVFSSGVHFGGAPPVATLLLLLLSPLALHALTAGITGWGAQRDGRTFASAFALAVAIHTSYNVVVLTISGGWRL